MTIPGDTVPERQNSPRGLKLLRARSEIYRQAQSLQKRQLLLTVFAPFVGALIGIIFPEARAYVATLSLAVAVIDASFLDRAQRSRLKLAAKVSEVFDTEVLDLKWSIHTAGAPPTPEQIAEAADAWRDGDDRLRDWYPAAVGKAAPHLARVVCQRTNLWYDAELRRRYSGLLLGITLVGLSVLLVIGLIARLRLVDFSATVLTPAAPMLIWALRDFHRQRDAADAQAGARAEADQLWAEVLAGNCDDDECTRRSRELQDTIYARRASNPLVFPGLYKRLRPRLETQMNAGASELLAQAGLDVDVQAVA